MDSILQQITDWLKEMLISAIMGNLSGMFESVNNQVGEIATSVGRTPESFSPEIFAMVRNISESVIIPIAGLILTFIACYELIQLIIDHNNLANFETWIFFKWVFKTFVAVMLITNTFNITMAVFDVAQHVVNASGGIIAGNTAIDASGLEALEETLQGMDLGPLIGLLLQSFVVQITMSALAIIIFVIVYKEKQNTDLILSEGEAVRTKVRDNIELDLLCRNQPESAPVMQEIYELVVETIQLRSPVLRLGSNLFPMALVRERLLQLTSEHIRFVLDGLRNLHTDVKNLKKYLLTMLFNAPVTLNGRTMLDVRKSVNSAFRPMLA